MNWLYSFLVCLLIAGATPTKGQVVGGGVDPTFQFEDAVNGPIRAILPLPGGRIIVGGDFTRAGGTDQAFIAMFEEDGTFVPEFAPILNGPVNALDSGVIEEISFPGISSSTLQVVAGGAFSVVNGESHAPIVQFNLSGEVTANYGPDIVGAVHAVYVHVRRLFEEGDKIEELDVIFGGEFTSTTDPFLANLARRHSSNGRIVAHLDGPVYTISGDRAEPIVTSAVWIGGDFSSAEIPIGTSGLTIESSVSNLAQVLLGAESGEIFIEKVGGDDFLVDGPVTNLVVHGVPRLQKITFSGGFENVGSSRREGLASFSYLSSDLGSPGDVELIDLPNPSGGEVTAMVNGGDGELLIGFSNGDVRRWTQPFVLPHGLFDWRIDANYAAASKGGAVIALGGGDNLNPVTEFRAYASRASEDGSELSLERLNGRQGSEIPASPEIVNLQINATNASFTLGRIPGALRLFGETSSDGGETWAPLLTSAVDDSLRRVARENQLLAEELMPGTEYLIRFASETSVGVSAFSEPAAFFTSDGSEGISESLLFNPLVIDGMAIDSVDILAEGVDGRLLLSADLEGDEYSEARRFLVHYSEDFKLVAIRDVTSTRGNRVLARDAVALSNGGFAIVYADAELTSSAVTIFESDLEISTDAARYDPEDTRFLRFLAAENDLVLRVVMRDNITRGIRVATVGANGIEQSAIAIPDTMLGDLFFDRVYPLSNQSTLITTFDFVGTVAIIITRDGEVLTDLPILTDFIFISAVVELSDGVIAVSGRTQNDSVYPSEVRLYTADGERCLGFAPVFESSSVLPPDIWSLARGTAGNLLVGGDFDLVNGTSASGHVELDRDGNLVSNPFFSVNGSLVANVQSLKSGRIFAFAGFREDSRLLYGLFRGTSEMTRQEFWQERHGLDSLDDLTTDDDNDGISLGLEYAYDLDPRVPELFSPIVMDGTTGNVVPVPVADARVQPFFSTDLSEFEPVPLEGDFTVRAPEGEDQPRGFFLLSGELR